MSFDRSRVTRSFASRPAPDAVTEVTWLGTGAAFDLRGSDRDNTLAFIAAHPLDEENELDFSPPLEVPESGVNIAVTFDVPSSFRNADGTLIDARTPVSARPNASIVCANIGTLLALFQDDDHDGQDDHGGHGGHGSVD